MKKLTLKLLGLLLLHVIQTTIYAQSAAQKQVLVYFKTGVQRNAPPNQNTVTITSANVTQVLNSYGLNANNVSSPFPNFNEADTVKAEIGEASRRMNYAKVFTISLPDTSFKSSLINSLKNLTEVLYAETNGDLTKNIIPADGRFAQQWNMLNTVVPGADIHAEPAWDIFTGNPNAIIAIIDDGVDANHNDLNAKILGGDNGFQVGLDGLGREVSHGSHVAGIAAAVSNNNNNNGVAGVDWQARVHPKNIFDGNGDPDITQSIIDAVNFDQNVWTLNNSWSTRNPDGTPGRYSVTVRSAFAHAYRNNRVQCVAMGNHQITNPNAVGIPAGFNSGIIAVGATDIGDNITGFSAQGPHVDVSAPGNLIWSTNFNNNYIDISGTSMATPHVAGLASLLRGFNTNLANDDIEQIIRLSANDVNALNFPGFDNQMGTGRINAERALQSLQAPNQLLQWNTTGGTVFNTTGNQTRIFLGVPGFADAAYVVKRSEVRTNVTFPTGMCTMLGAWGRGVGTTGYREEQGRCFGEGICEIVPGTLTNTGATLRTWIYEVWAVNGQYFGFWPRAANNVIFQYSVLGVPRPVSITGDDVVCTTVSNNYTIPNLPTGATVQWQVTPAGIATPNSPNSPQTTVTRNNNGIITLTAIISNACGGGQITIQKQNIVIGIQSPTNIIGLNPPLGVSPGELLELDAEGNIPSYSWSVQGGTILGSSSQSHVTIQVDQCPPQVENGWINIQLACTNACGTGSYGEYTTIDCGTGGPMFVMSPNPATDKITIDGSKKNKSIKEIHIIDKLGNIKQITTYSGSQKLVNINISGLQQDIYYIRIYDGKKWESKQLKVQ